MHRPHGFRNSAIILLALCAASCDNATEPVPPSAALLTAETATTLTGTVRTEVVPAPTVRATDADGRALAGVPVTFMVSKDGGQISTIMETTDADGLASVGHWMLGPMATVQKVVARAAGVDDVVFTATAVAGPVTELQALSGMNQMAMRGLPLGTVLSVKAVDRWGNPVAGAPVTFTVTAGGGTIASAPAATDTAGIAASGVWTLGPDSGTQQVRATSDTMSTTFTAFSIQPHPELQGRLAFVSVVDGNAEIHTMNADGTELRRLTTNSWEDLQPVWTPSGEQITFVARSSELSRIYSMDADGQNITGLTPAKSYSSDPSWSAASSGTILTYRMLMRDDGDNIVSMNTGSGVASVLVRLPGYTGQPSWSPDGRRLAFVSELEGPDYDYVIYGYDIYTIGADGTGLTRLTQGVDGGETGTRYYAHPAWSPDGSLIAFIWGEFPRSSEDMRFHVAVMAPDGSGVRDLAWAGDVGGYSPLDSRSLAWSRDGRGIAFSFVNCGESAGAPCEHSVKYVPLAGGEPVTLIPNGSSPSWR